MAEGGKAETKEADIISHLIPQTPLDWILLASGLIPGRLGRAALGTATGVAVMSPREAHGELSLRDLTRVRK